MDIQLDHLYRETHHWSDAVAWWEGLGFSFTDQWGSTPHRAGNLVRGDMRVVLAEVETGSDPKATVFLATDDLEGIADLAGADIVDTHWGTRLVSLSDPDGRIYNFEPGEGS